MRQWIQGTVVLGCFDMIEELRKMQVHPFLVKWIITFLCNKTL